VGKNIGFAFSEAVLIFSYTPQPKPDMISERKKQAPTYNYWAMSIL
jgi:hypothetical protein